MRTAKLLKLAASTLVLGTGLGIGSGALLIGQASASSKDGSLVKTAMLAAQKAQAALGAHKAETAVNWAEKAVAAMPQDSGYRMLLGEAYLAAGRFASAETAFTDTLTLSPKQEKAALKSALAKIALGKNSDAMGVLEANREAMSVADYGLALALAGDVQAAITTLESAVRGYDSTAKLRQNLALSYALSGRWREARTVAMQDLPTDLVNRRMSEWAAFSRPTTAYDQVASLLGVKPVYDAGQPTALALSNQADAPALAEATPTEPGAASPDQVAVAAYEAPLQTTEANAAAEPSPVAVDVAATEPVASSGRKIVFAPLSPIVQPIREAHAEADAPMIRSNRNPVKQAVVSARPHSSPQAASKLESGRFAVQLGAYSSASRADAAWAKASKRNASLAKYDSARNRVKVKNASLYRLAVVGFTSREDASRVCTEVRATGGSCFVRSSAGDTNIRLAKRGNGTKLAMRKKNAKIAMRKSGTKIAVR
jgi:Flp pilus assembly protein TadD